MTAITIRGERPGDESAIRQVIIGAFESAEHRDGTEQDIVERLRAAGTLSVLLAAEAAGEIVGHVAFSPGTAGDAAGTWYGLAPVSVKPRLQRQGIGDSLIREGLRLLTERGAAGCVVLGEPEYYCRFGFEHDPALSYPDAPAPYFQRLVIKGAPPQGVARYHPAFG